MISDPSGKDTSEVIVVGGGPSGMMASIRAAQLGSKVTLIEKKRSLGSKLLLSGKGRCNLTNACDLDAFLKRFSANGQFLRDAFKLFFNTELMYFFEKRGLKLKVERQQRVFPESDSSGSVLDVLKKELQKLKVRIRFGTGVKDILIEDCRVKGIVLEDGEKITADRVIMATGGVSYGFTGSTGEGSRIAVKLGHDMIDFRPGLVPLETLQEYPRLLEGLTLKNIRLKFTGGKKQIVSDIGELMFTKSGISGPLVLSLSGSIIELMEKGDKVSVYIDLKPALSEEKLDARLLRELNSNPRKGIKNILPALMPKRLATVFMDILDIPPDEKAGQVTQDQRRRIVRALKALKLDITGSKPIDKAMITRGGISLKDIDPRTMESRRIKGLYFAGEMIDIDADTGGFNLQAAFSTGYLAGENASHA